MSNNYCSNNEIKSNKIRENTTNFNSYKSFLTREMRKKTTKDTHREKKEFEARAIASKNVNKILYRLLAVVMNLSV